MFLEVYNTKFNFAQKTLTKYSEHQGIDKLLHSISERNDGPTQLLLQYSLCIS